MMFAAGEQNTSKYVDEVEKTVYSHLKPLGFKKYGRTLQRIVSDDIPQVINFQISAGFDRFCVNLGIRVHECAARLYDEPQEIKNTTVNTSAVSEQGSVPSKTATEYGLTEYGLR